MPKRSRSIISPLSSIESDFDVVFNAIGLSRRAKRRRIGLENQDSLLRFEGADRMHRSDDQGAQEEFSSNESAVPVQFRDHLACQERPQKVDHQSLQERITPGNPLAPKNTDLIHNDNDGHQRVVRPLEANNQEEMNHLQIDIGTLPADTDSTTTPTHTEMLEEADKFFNAKEWANSISCFKILLKKSPNHIQTLYKIACAHRELNHFEQSMHYFRQASALGHAKSLFSLGAVFWRWGNSSNCIPVDQCDQLAQKCFIHAANQGCVDAMPFVGSLYHFGRADSQRNISEAKRWYIKSLHCPETPSNLKACAAHNLGLIFLRDEDDAQKDYLLAKYYYDLAEKFGYDVGNAKQLVSKLILEQTCVR
eukprot:CAMPEP_0117451614 /NCGR_PEP_ID=MMETSP0759-20121206/9107_1 /TAXON_ID=63605 /ORGANISM="Percolomonas cosmopolitus, Strain WS" /LENGTH=364 /DNA_ID=CAMNT_0005244237 /DNA_START=153 /DNA_END=1243 /DNA_ORIENTATION=+